MIINFHGFASIGDNSKHKALKEAFPSEIILSPNLPVNPTDVIKLIDDIILDTKEPILLVGSSFGGFYAFYTSVIYKKHCVLINPSLKPWRTLREAVGFHEKFVTGEKFEWKKEYLTILEELDERIKRVGVVESRLSFFLSNDDEVLDHSSIKNDYQRAESIRYYNNCEHRFIRLNEIIPHIVGIYNKLKTNERR